MDILSPHNRIQVKYLWLSYSIAPKNNLKQTVWHFIYFI